MDGDEELDMFNQQQQQSTGENPFDENVEN